MSLQIRIYDRTGLGLRLPECRPWSTEPSASIFPARQATRIHSLILKYFGDFIEVLMVRNG